MNPLVKKEIRLLLPGWLAVLLLDILLPWFGKNPDGTFAWMPVFIFFGMIILAVDSFGREFNLRTFQSLLSQPVERRRIWRVKITVLLFAAALIFAAYFASCGLRLHLALTDSNSVWRANPTTIESDFRNVMFGSVAALLIALTGGLWTALLLRQIAAAFWITFLTPAGLLMLIAFVMSKFFNSASDFAVFSVLYGAAGLYVVSGFWLAHRLFHRAQDAAWTGGFVNFSRWRYFESGTQSTFSIRRRRPVAALLKKEFQLHSVSLICAGALLAVHIAVILMRKVHGHFGPHSMAGTVSEFYWALWLAMPLIIGCTAVAEEQRLGVMEGQFCLPAFRRLQFALKFFLATCSGLLFGALMPLLVERMAASIGAPNPDFHFNNPAEGFVPTITVASIALGLSLAGIFASTLTKNILQAMGIAVLTIVGCCLFTYVAADIHGNLHSFLGVTLNPRLTLDIAVLTAFVIFPSLTYRNFKYFQECGRMWRRNVWGLTGAILFIFISSAALYNRSWEMFEPAEPAHGPAKLLLSHPPVFLNAPRYNLLVRLPDGRVWFDYFGYRPTDFHRRSWPIVEIFKSPMLESAGPWQFLSGSNWAWATAGYINEIAETAGSQKSVPVFGYLDSVGIKSDGTLWASGKSDQNVWTADKLTQFGDETNWQQVVRPFKLGWVLLLKTDGTLWRWGTNHFNWDDWPQKWPGLRAFSPHQIGTNAGWSEIFSAGGNCLARKTDGSVWSVMQNENDRKQGFIRETNYDSIVSQKFSETLFGDFGAYVRNDGTLWFFKAVQGHGQRQPEFETWQSGKDTNWVGVAVAYYIMVALKSDGTLWKWNRNWWDHDLVEDYTVPPTRLGIHNDWVAIAGSEFGVVSFAADGSLWFWPFSDRYCGYGYEPTLLKLPKQPKFLGNVFGKAD